VREPPERRCIGQYHLMLSTHVEDHERAKRFCADCPAFDWCERDRDDQLRGPYKIGVHGTLAGKLYDDGKRVTTGNGFADDCPQCGASDGHPCKSPAGTTLHTTHRARLLGLPQCRLCATPFTPSRQNNHYCSKVCSREATRARKAREFVKQKNACVTCLAPTSKTYCRTCAAKMGQAARQAAS
jgi:hypothetical protein